MAEKDELKTEIKKMQKSTMTSKEQEAVLKQTLQHKDQQYAQLEMQYKALEDQYKEKQDHLNICSEQIAVLMTENEKIRAYQETIGQAYQATVAELHNTLASLQNNVIQLLERVTKVPDAHEKE